MTERLLRVLFVDDDEPVLQTIWYTLRDRFEIFTAHSTADALELLRRKAIDVVVADHRLAHGEPRGSALCETIRREHPGTGRLILTAYAGDEDLRACRGLRILEKPFVPEDLEEAIRQAATIGRRSSAPHERKGLLARLMRPKPNTIDRELREIESEAEARHDEALGELREATAELRGWRNGFRRP